ncbi:Transcription initiation factor IIA subunit 1 [Chelonia mydas]|uniref:Transcription initiation factor IIA subunit 1 n=1 Tax=Chelonia mydas TaxID=8469 RepID=M7AK72_CHEMY|nr:Transcription initiation factor IIA subunit 1 [Chelonia mydas]
MPGRKGTVAVLVSTTDRAAKSPVNSTAAELRSVIEDVINDVREVFLDEGVDEQVLLELKTSAAATAATLALPAGVTPVQQILTNSGQILQVVRTANGAQYIIQQQQPVVLQQQVIPQMQPGGVQAPVIQQEPLNSEDDVSDEEGQELFDTENVVVCQYDKVTFCKMPVLPTLILGIYSHCAVADLKGRRLKSIDTGTVNLTMLFLTCESHEQLVVLMTNSPRIIHSSDPYLDGGNRDHSASDRRRALECPGCGSGDLQHRGIAQGDKEFPTIVCCHELTYSGMAMGTPLKEQQLWKANNGVSNVGPAVSLDIAAVLVPLKYNVFNTHRAVCVSLSSLLSPFVDLLSVVTSHRDWNV